MTAPDFPCNWFIVIWQHKNSRPEVSEFMSEADARARVKEWQDTGPHMKPFHCIKLFSTTLVAQWQNNEQVAAA